MQRNEKQTAWFRDLIAYMGFGLLSGAVNYAVFLVCFHQAGLPGFASNLIAWAVASVVAFLTNKRLVFQSRDWSSGKVWPEFLKFICCRAGSGLLETGIVLITVDLLRWNVYIFKIAASLTAMLLNYLGIKMFVFRNPEKK